MSAALRCFRRCCRQHRHFGRCRNPPSLANGGEQRLPLLLRHAKKAGSPSLFLALDALALAEACAEKAVIVKRHGRRKVAPQPFGALPAVGHRLIFRGVPGVDQ
jgi:hypothetical protein